MVVKLKQPLRLADNLSAFDPQAPLNLSADMLSRISIPIADRSAVSGQRVGRGTLVRDVSQHNQLSPYNNSPNVEHLSHVYEGLGYRWTPVFSQELKGLWCLFLSGSGLAYIIWDMPSHDNWNCKELYDGESMFLRFRKQTWYFGMYGSAGPGTLYLTGIY